MKIEGTELEYSECDSICLDYYLSSYTETKEQWAKRVWKFCKEYQETDGDGYPPEQGGFFAGENASGYLKRKMPSVYSKNPHALWEAKKRSRRMSLIAEFDNIKKRPHLCDVMSIEKEIKQEMPVALPPEYSDENVMKIKNDKGYLTADEQHKAIEERLAKKQADLKVSIQEKVNKLKEKFDEETIKIIYPLSAKVLK